MAMHTAFVLHPKCGSRKIGNKTLFYYIIFFSRTFFTEIRILLFSVCSHNMYLFAFISVVIVLRAMNEALCCHIYTYAYTYDRKQCAVLAYRAFRLKTMSLVGNDLTIIKFNIHYYSNIILLYNFKDLLYNK